MSHHKLHSKYACIYVVTERIQDNEATTNFGMFQKIARNVYKFYIAKGRKLNQPQERSHCYRYHGGD